MSLDDGICPQCGSLLVYPRTEDVYCEDCGWPDEDLGQDGELVPMGEEP